MNRQQRRAAKKVRVPKLGLDPLTRLAMCRVYEPDEIVAYQAKVHLALNAFREGKGTRDDFDEVTMAFNVGLVRAEVISQQLVDTLVKGQRAFLRLRDRAKQGGPMLFDSGGFIDAANALEVFDAILIESSPMQMTMALAEVNRRLDRKVYVQPK